MSINPASISNAYIIMYEMEPPPLTSQLSQEVTIKPSTPSVVSTNGTYFLSYILDTVILYYQEMFLLNET